MGKLAHGDDLKSAWSYHVTTKSDNLPRDSIVARYSSTITHELKTLNTLLAHLQKCGSGGNLEHTRVLAICCTRLKRRTKAVYERRGW